MIDSVTEQDATWAPVPEKFEAGTQDAAGIYATGAALTYLTRTVGYDAVAARESALVSYLMGRMAELDFIDVIGPADASGVCIRAGHHCAQPLLTWLGVENLACCRASVAFYNDKSDVDRLIDGLEQVWQVFHGRD